MFSKKLSAFPHSDRAVPALLPGCQPSSKIPHQIKSTQARFWSVTGGCPVTRRTRTLRNRIRSLDRRHAWGYTGNRGGYHEDRIRFLKVLVRRVTGQPPVTD